jgi:hypothetical protein
MALRLARVEQKHTRTHLKVEVSVEERHVAHRRSSPLIGTGHARTSRSLKRAQEGRV